MTTQPKIEEPLENREHPSDAALTALIAEYKSLLDHRERQIEAIRRTSESLFVHPSVDSMVEATLKIALDVLRADAGTVFLHDPTDDSLVFRYVIGLPRPSSRDKAAIQSRGGRMDGLSQPQADSRRRCGEAGDFNRQVDERTGYHTESMMTVPVKRSDSEPIGVMQVLNARVPFTARDLEVLEGPLRAGRDGHRTRAPDGRCAQGGDRSCHRRYLARHQNMLTPILTGIWTLEPMLHSFFEDLEQIRSRCPETETWAHDLEKAARAVREKLRVDARQRAQFREQVQARTKEIADAVKGEMTPPVFESGDLNETAEAIIRPLQVVADKAGVRLILDLQSDLRYVEFDRKQISTRLYNLVNNAIPETPSGGTVTLRTREIDGDMIQIDVIDTGRGMTEKIRTLLFTDSAQSTKPGGTGLGRALSSASSAATMARSRLTAHPARARPSPSASPSSTSEPERAETSQTTVFTQSALAGIPTTASLFRPILGLSAHSLATCSP